MPSVETNLGNWELVLIMLRYYRGCWMARIWRANMQKQLVAARDIVRFWQKMVSCYAGDGTNMDSWV
jgi:hypothetical protein